jgi:aspartyl-tRNA synthetase
LNEVAQHKEFPVFNAAELVVGIAAPGVGNYTRKEIDALIDWVKRPQVEQQEWFMLNVMRNL